MEMNANNVLLLLLQIIMHIFPMIVSSLIKKMNYMRINISIPFTWSRIMQLSFQIFNYVASKYIWILIVLMLYLFVSQIYEIKTIGLKQQNSTLQFIKSTLFMHIFPMVLVDGKQQTGRYLTCKLAWILCNGAEYQWFESVEFFEKT